MNEQAVSYVSGISAVTLKYQTIGDAFDQTVAQHGERDAVVVCHQNIRWSYDQLADQVNRMAAGLVALGLNRGDRVALWSPNNIQWLITQFATAKAGLILVNINPAYKRSELEYSLNKVSCKALILLDKFKSSNYVEILHTIAPEITDCPKGQLKLAKLPQLKIVIVIAEIPPEGCYSFQETSVGGEDNIRETLTAIAQKLQPDDPINIQFTSGTTGFPKGATLTHHNILNNGFFVTERQQITAKDRLCIPVPLYHCFGMVMGVLGAVTHGACMVFPDESFDPISTLTAIEAEKCTALYGVPTMFIGMLNHEDFKNFDLRSLRTGVMAGSPCPTDVMKQVITEMHMSEITICYGMTETSPVSFQSIIGDPIEKLVSTVGKIHPFLEVKIIGEDGRAVSRGQQGEICTRGYSVMQGYWNDPERTNEAIDAALWMHTGDLGTMNIEGYVTITGRVKDMIIRGGENIYPREIEEFLFQHQKIEDVQVFGVPDEKFGEQICAWIKVKVGHSLTEEEIQKLCKQELAHFKAPHYLHFVTEFPMTVTGKIQKFKMRDQMIKHLNIPLNIGEKA